MLPSDNSTALKDVNAEMIKGDVCDIDSLEPLFLTDEPREIIVYTCCGNCIDRFEI